MAANRLGGWHEWPLADAALKAARVGLIVYNVKRE
jgi:hypothetical protein